MVAHLINTDLMCWDSRKLPRRFSEVELTEIEPTPIALKMYKMFQFGTITSVGSSLFAHFTACRRID